MTEATPNEGNHTIYEEPAKPSESQVSSRPTVAERYSRPIDADSNSTHARVLRLVGKNKRVLDLGCAAGHMSKVLAERGCSVVGVEVDPDAAALARQFCERVIVGDLDAIDFASELEGERFDVVVAADVLEHLKDPLRVLTAAKDLLQPEGYVVASLPNVAHGSVRLALLSGRFPYTDTGLLDRTHLRFFTWESAQRLFEDGGFVIGEMERVKLNLTASEVAFDEGSLAPELINRLSADEEALTYQFVLVAYPLPVSGLGLVQNKMRALVEENASLQSELDRYRSTVEEQTRHLDAQQAMIEQLTQQQHNLRTRLLEAHDQLLQRDEEIVRLRQDLALRVAHIADLQAALDRILYSRPGRVYRALRDWVFPRRN